MQTHDMQTVETGRATSRKLRIRTDECLDWRSYNLFDSAALKSNYHPIKEIEIDLRNTRVIKDSGLTMLLMLIKQSGQARDGIALVNCRPELRSRLAECTFSSRFHFR